MCKRTTPLAVIGILLVTALVTVAAVVWVRRQSPPVAEKPDGSKKQLPPVDPDSLVGKLTSVLEKKEQVSRSKLAAIGQAAEKLGEMGLEAGSAVPALTRLLHDRQVLVEFSVVRKVVIALGQIGPGAKSAVPRLIEMLGIEKPRGGPIVNTCCYRIEIAEALWRITGDADLIVPTLEMLKDYVNVRQAAVRLLGKIGSLAEPALLRLLKGDDNVKREEAAKVLGTLRPTSKAIIDALTEAVQTEGRDNWWLRANSAEALGQIGPAAKKAVPVLVKRAMTRAEFNCARAVWQITGDLGQAVPCLVHVLEHGHVYRDYGSVGPPPPGEDKPINTQRIAAASLLGEIGPDAKAAIHALEKALKDEDEHVRAAAAVALKKIRSRE